MYRLNFRSSIMLLTLGISLLNISEYTSLELRHSTVSPQSKLFHIDTIPIVYKIDTDTISSYDCDSNKETVELVKRKRTYYEIIDTTYSKDKKTGEQLIQIVKNFAPVPKQNSIHDLYDSSELDTITVFDMPTYEETVSIFPNLPECYILSWGERYYRGSVVLDKEVVRDIFYAEPNVALNDSYARDHDCENPQSVTATISVAPLKGDPKSQNISPDHRSIHPDFISSTYLVSGTKIFVENILVNGQYPVSNLVIQIK